MLTRKLVNRLLERLRELVPLQWKRAAHRARALPYLFLAPFAVLRARLNRRGGRRNARTVVFVSSYVGIRQVKVASALRGAGWRVILLYQWRLPSQFPASRYFDRVERCNSEWQALWRVASYAPVATHVFSTSSEPFAETLIKYKPSAVLYDAKDVFERSALPRTGLSAREVEAIRLGQRYCIQKADGLCCRDLQVSRLCREEHLSRPRATYFPEYCRDEPTVDRTYWKPGDEIHVVSANFIGLEKLGFQEHRYLELSRMFAAQGIHVHIYQWGTLSGVTFEEAYSDYLQLESETRFFHLHRTVPFEQLQRELRQYHIGLLMALSLSYREPQRTRQVGMAGCEGSATVYDYLDAGLPVMCHKSTYAYAKLARYGLAIDSTAEMLQNAHEVLSGFLSQDVEQRVQRARAAYAARRHAGRLADFYERLAASLAP